MRRNRKAKGLKINTKAKIKGSIAYRTKAFGKFNIYRIFKESDVKRDASGKFTFEGAVSKAYGKFNRQQRKEKIAKDKKSQLKNQNQESQPNLLTLDSKSAKKNQPNSKLIRISFAKKIKPLLEKIEEIVTQKSKPLSSKGTALPKDSRGKIKPAGIMLKSGERNFSVMLNNLKEFREAFGEFSTKQILLSYNISLLTAENRKKLLDEYRRFINFKAPELFADGQVYNSLKDIRAALVKQNDVDALNKEFFESRLVASFLSSTTWAKLSTIPEYKVNELFKDIKSVNDSANSKRKDFKAAKEAGTYKVEKVADKEQIAQFLKSTIDSINIQKEELIRNALIANESAKVPKSDKEIIKEIETETKLLIEYVTKLGRNAEVVGDRTILSNKLQIKDTFLKKLPILELMQLREQLLFEIGNDVDKARIQLFLFNLEKDDIYQVPVTKIKQGYQLHHVNQFASFDVNGNPYFAIEKAYGSNSKDSLKAISEEDLLGLTVNYDESGNISYFYKDYFSEKGAKLKGSVFLKDLPLSYYRNNWELIVDKTDNTIIGFKNPESGETVSWDKAISEMNHSPKLYLDLPIAYHEKSRVNSLYGLLHPVENYTIKPDNDIQKSQLSNLSELASKLNVSKKLQTELEEGLKTGKLKAGKGQVESERHDEVRDNLYLYRRIELYEQVEKAVISLLEEIPSTSEKAIISNSAKYNYYKNGIRPSYVNNLTKLEERLAFLTQSAASINDLLPSDQNSSQSEAIKNIQEKIKNTKNVIKEIDKVTNFIINQGLNADYIRNHTPSQFFDSAIKNPRIWGLPANATPKMVMNAIMNGLTGSTLTDNFPSLDDQLKPLPKEPDISDE